MILSGAQILMKALKDEGVGTIFGYPGGAVIELYDELVKTDIQHVLFATSRARFIRLTVTLAPVEKWGLLWLHPGPAPPTP